MKTFQTVAFAGVKIVDENHAVNTVKFRYVLDCWIHGEKRRRVYAGERYGVPSGKTASLIYPLKPPSV
jgi:hypothetical protein